MANQYAGLGAKLQYGGPTTASPISFVTVAQVRDIDGPSQKTKTHDVTSHDSATVAGGYAQFITGLKDGGEVKFPLWFDATDTTQNATTTGLKGIMDSAQNSYWQILLANYPAATSPPPAWTFQGPIIDLDFTQPVDGAQAIKSCTIKVSGKPVLIA